MRGGRAPAVPALLLAAALVAVPAGCDREERAYRSIPTAESSASAVRLVGNTPGPRRPDPEIAGPYRANAWGIAQGKKLYGWYNCVGCHAHGGGGMGPPLLDEEWIYGSDAEEIYASIAQGRPNGMPAFGGLVPADQIWQLVAYVQSMSGMVRHDAAPGRADAMHVAEPELLREPPEAIEGEAGAAP